MESKLAAVSDVFGKIEAPSFIKGGLTGENFLGRLISTGVKILIVFAGLYAFFNLILAGYSFISAGDDPKKVAGSWAKIWQTLLGLIVAAGAFVLADIFSQLIFGENYNILKPILPTLP